MSGFEHIEIGEALPKAVKDRAGRLVVIEKGVTDTLLPGLPQQCRPGNRSFAQFNRMIGAGVGRIAGGEACKAVLEVKKLYPLFLSFEEGGWVQPCLRDPVDIHLEMNQRSFGVLHQLSETGTPLLRHQFVVVEEQSKLHTVATDAGARLV